MPFRSGIVRAVFVTAWLLLAWIYFMASASPAIGTYHDDGIYLVTARALAEDRGYRIISMPDEPLQTKYPVLFPWMLSILWRIYPAFPDNLPWLRLAGLGSGVAWLVLSWRLLRRLGFTRDACWVVVLLLAASPSILFFSTTTMAEMPFAALIAAGMLALTRIHDGDGRRYDGALAGVFMGASMLTRAAGVASVLGGFVALAIERRWRLLAQYTAAVLALTAPWLWWVAQHNAALSALDSYYSATPYRSWNIVFSYDFGDKVRVLVMNALYSGMAPAAFWDIRMPTWWGLTVAVFLCLIIGRGLWNVGMHPAAVVLTIYLGTVLCWVWPPLRFLAPVAPGIAWLVVAGTPRGLYAERVLVLAIAIPLTLQLWGQTLERIEKQTAWPHAGYADDWRMTEPLFEWIARETPTDAILTGNLDPQYFLYTGRKAIRAFSPDAFLLYYPSPRPTNPLGTVEQLRQRLRVIGARYLIMTPGAGFGESPYLRALVSELTTARPGSLTVAYGSVATGYVIYEIHSEHLLAPIAARAE